VTMSTDTKPTESGSTDGPATATDLSRRLITPFDDEWPTAATLGMQVAPAGGTDFLSPGALWARGSAQLNEVVTCAVAFVGSRLATPYGTKVAFDLARVLAGRGWTIVSNGDYGIGGAAHRGALAAADHAELATAGPTIAVVAGAPARPYPPAHAGLFETVTAHGLLVGIASSQRLMARDQLSARDRLTVALTAGIVVVEAGTEERIDWTVGHAREMGRPLMAVPGPITSEQSAGCHRLLQEDARLVTKADDILETIRAAVPRPAVPPLADPGRTGDSRATPGRRAV